MNEKRIISLLARRAAGELGAEELTELQKLLAAHPDGVYYEEFVRELWHCSSPGVSADDAERYFERHKQRHGSQLEFGGRGFLGWFGSRRQVVMSGLVLVLAFAVGLWLLRDKDSDAPSGQIEIVAQRGVRKQVVLPDGTRVWLNADSRLVYDGELETGDTRKVRLEGEAYFDVTRNKNRPFIITTDKISVKVLGTTFNVKAYPDEAKAEATLISGQIELTVNDRPKEKILMEPNEKVAVVDHPVAEVAGGGSEDKRLTLTIGNLSKVQVDDQEYIEETLWMKNKLMVKDETLEEIVPKLERWYNVDITLRDPRIRSYRYTATITEKNIAEVLEAMQLIKSFHFKIDSNDVVIY